MRWLERLYVDWADHKIPVTQPIRAPKQLPQEESLSAWNYYCCAELGFRRNFRSHSRCSFFYGITNSFCRLLTMCTQRECLESQKKKRGERKENQDHGKKMYLASKTYGKCGSRCTPLSPCCVVFTSNRSFYRTASSSSTPSVHPDSSQRDAKFCSQTLDTEKKKNNRDVF